MKKLVIIITAAVFLLWNAACKKCFHCFNDCQQCTLTVGTHSFSHVLCRDSFATEQQYKAAITADSAYGYVCAATASTYNYDFCTNQSGEEPYPAYFNKGGKATCNEK